MQYFSMKQEEARIHMVQAGNKAATHKGVMAISDSSKDASKTFYTNNGVS
jgi:hypothetical protein